MLTVPNIEAAVRTILLAACPDVATKIPAPRPARFVELWRSGGARRDLIRSDAQVMVRCWAVSDTDAWHLAQNTWGLLCDAAHTVSAGLQIDSVSLTDPVNNPDPASGTPRYQYIASLRVALVDKEIP